MSQNNAVNFLESVYRDSELNQQLTQSESWEDVVQVASDAGYSFSAQEYTEALTVISEKYDVDSPLSEQQLDLVSGGTTDVAAAGCCCCCCACCCDLGLEL